MADDPLHCLYLEERILESFLVHAERNDGERRFAGIRRPSKTTRAVRQQICDIHDRRKKLNG